MRMTLGRRDLVALVGLTAAAAFAVSLGVDPALATELAVAAALLQLVAVLLREEPASAPPGPPRAAEDALAAARRAVDSALSGRWGVHGRLRRVVRDAVHARLAREEQDLDDVRDRLPAELVVLLDARWEHDRGLTPTELDRILTAVERLDP